MVVVVVVVVVVGGGGESLPNLSPVINTNSDLFYIGPCNITMLHGNITMLHGSWLCNITMPIMSCLLRHVQTGMAPLLSRSGAGL